MKNKMTAKQIAALLAVVLLAALYLITLFAAIFDTSAAGSLFRICLICTVVVPLLTWVFIWLYGQTTGKSTIADVHLLEEPKDYRKKKREDALPLPMESFQADSQESFQADSRESFQAGSRESSREET